MRLTPKIFFWRADDYLFILHTFYILALYALYLNGSSYSSEYEGYSYTHTHTLNTLYMALQEDEKGGGDPDQALTPLFFSSFLSFFFFPFSCFSARKSKNKFLLCLAPKIFNASKNQKMQTKAENFFFSFFFGSKSNFKKKKKIGGEKQKKIFSVQKQEKPFLTINHFCFLKVQICFL